MVISWYSRIAYAKYTLCIYLDQTFLYKWTIITMESTKLSMSLKNTISLMIHPRTFGHLHLCINYWTLIELINMCLRFWAITFAIFFLNVGSNIFQSLSLFTVSILYLKAPAHNVNGIPASPVSGGHTMVPCDTLSVRPD